MAISYGNPRRKSMMTASNSRFKDMWDEKRNGTKRPLEKNPVAGLNIPKKPATPTVSAPTSGSIQKVSPIPKKPATPTPLRGNPRTAVANKDRVAEKMVGYADKMKAMTELKKKKLILGDKKRIEELEKNMPSKQRAENDKYYKTGKKYLKNKPNQKGGK